MPVKPAKERNPRSILIGVGLFSVGIILILGLFVLAIPKLSEQGTIEVQLGSATFDAGFAQNLIESVTIEPVLFSDVANGQRDIYVAHFGDDPTKGWIAFDARQPGRGRECPLVFDRGTRTFTDTCDKTIIPGDGSGLPHYPVEVKDGKVIIDLNADRRGTTTIQVTGTIPR